MPQSTRPAAPRFGLRALRRGTATRRSRVALVAGVVGLAVVALAPTTSMAAAPTCPTSDLASNKIAFTTDLNHGSLQIGKSASSTGNSAHGCGLVTAAPDGQLVASIAPANLTFAPATTKVLFLNLPTTTTALTTISGPVSIGADGADVALAGTLQASTKIGFFTCVVGPITPKLTTGTSGALTGSKFVPQPDGSLAGRVVSNDFSVPAIKASPTCPGIVAALNNALLGLPLAPGKSSIVFDGSFSLDLG